MSARRALVLVALGAWVAGCDRFDVSASCEGCGVVTLTPRSLVSDGCSTGTGIAIGPDGRFQLDVVLEDPRLVQGARAQLDILTSPAPGGARTADTLALVRDQSGAHRASTRLAWPGGGLIDLRLRAGGVETIQTVRLEPVVLAVELCAAPNAADPGTIVELRADVSCRDASADAGGRAGDGTAVEFGILPDIPRLPAVAPTRDGVATTTVRIPVDASGSIHVEASAAGARDGCTLGEPECACP